MENNFDENLKNILSNPPNFPVDSETRAQFIQQLDTVAIPTQPAKNNDWKKAALLLAFLLMGGAFGYLFSKFQTLNSQLLEKNQLQNTKILDTIIQKQVTVIYDTIYISEGNKQLTTNRNTYNSNYQPFQKHLLNSNFYNIFTASLTAPNLFDQKINLLTDYAVASTWKKVNTRSNKSLKDIDDKKGVANQPISLLKTNHLNNINSSQKILLPEWLSEISIDNKRMERQLKRLRRRQMVQPKSIAIGIHGGLSRDLTLYINNTEQSNNTLGLRTEIGFNSNFSLLIGANYRKQQFKTEEDDDQPVRLENFPVPPPQDIEDELQEVNWDAAYLEIPFGFKYSFLMNKKIQPYFGIGLVSRKALRSTIEFEYETPAEEEYEEQQLGVLTSEFQINNAWGVLGTQYKFTENWRFFLEGGYQFDWKNKDLTKIEAVKLIQANAGISYQF